MKRPAFTLIEILVSAAIMGTLTTIVFFNFSRQNQKQALADTIGTIGTELQHMTANAQSGILLNGAVPTQYGLHFDLFELDGSAKKSFITFGDLNPINSTATLYDSGGGEVIQTFKFPKTVTMYCISNIAGQEYSRLDLGYGLPGGKFTAVGTLRAPATTVAVTTETRVTLRDSRTNACRRIILRPGVTTFSQQQLTSCSCS